MPALSRSPSRSRGRGSSSRGRQFSPVEIAIGLSLGGSLLAVAIPTFAREIHASRVAEPVEGLGRIGAGAVEYARPRPVADAFPASAPLSPSTVPRGKCEVDPPALWDQPTWQALAFAPAPPGAPHCFAFAFDSAASPSRSTFRAQAHGDLDGDGTTSTFEITGHVADGDPLGPAVDPGMYVDSEVE
jgi:hypothetical protein